MPIVTFFQARPLCAALGQRTVDPLIGVADERID